MRRQFKRYLQRKRLERQKIKTHAVINIRSIANNLEVITIDKQEELHGSDILKKMDGYHHYGTKWWTNPDCPVAYKYMSLEALYPGKYFGNGMAHPKEAESRELYKYMQNVFSSVFGKRFNSVLELGTGGGEITHNFLTDELDFIAVEGTNGGVTKLQSLGVPADRILQRNLKFLEILPRRFDLAMCTEVAEHLEPWFASKVVQNCTSHADVVWFSAARGDALPHYHHINEVPIEAWDNIFAHFGFNHFVRLNGTMGRADRLYFNDMASTRIVGKSE